MNDPTISDIYLGRMYHGGRVALESPPFIMPLSVENRLLRALERDEFVLHYQPKVDTESRVVVGLEALIRWQAAEVGVVPPEHFVPILESNGLIVEVGSWALRRAALDRRAWVEAGLRPPKVAVNVSAIQLRQPDFLDKLEDAIINGIAPRGIELELTESVLMDDLDAIVAKLHAVRSLGLSIALDDFGTGYSSLAYLAHLPVDAIKIERSFVSTMTEDPKQATVVRTIVSLAHSLRLKVIAEGVETEQQAKMLARIHCDELQGNLFAVPLTNNEVASLLKSELLRDTKTSSHYCNEAAHVICKSAQERRGDEVHNKSTGARHNTSWLRCRRKLMLSELSPSLSGMSSSAIVTSATSFANTTAIGSGKDLERRALAHCPQGTCLYLPSLIRGSSRDAPGHGSG
jgi:EAL domain-containing protein (putative c-di-GMP-specific phosphodiesterase class I)